MRDGRGSDVSETFLTVSAPNLHGLHTVFLDRDGTINVRAAIGEYVRTPAELVLLPGAAKAVAALNAAGLRVILVTNQRWLSEKSADPGCYAAVHARLKQLLAIEGAWLDAAYHCPHASGTCPCRKPKAGMLHRAAREHSFDLSGSVIVGDSDTDLLAGQAAGTATILLRGNGTGAVSSDAVVEDLDAAVHLILYGSRHTGTKLAGSTLRDRTVMRHCRLPQAIAGT
jgi:D-glycero-D-manno-heptose 1,7-bisphosphate phosphatase